MDIYSDAFNHIEYLLNSGYNNPMGHEQLIQKHLENNNVKFELRDFKNFLWRHEGNRSLVHSSKK